MTGGTGFHRSAVNGWIVVTGSGLPNPGCDVDECFYFLTELSRKLGHVQFFQAERFCINTPGYAWKMGGDARVAWAGETVWIRAANSSRNELSMNALATGKSGCRLLAAAEWTATNVAKVPLLAARWSLDPARIDERLRTTPTASPVNRHNGLNGTMRTVPDEAG